MKRASGEFHKFYMNDHKSYDRLKWDFMTFKINIISRRKHIVMLSMTLRKRAKVLLHVWSYDFYDTTLSTE